MSWYMTMTLAQADAQPAPASPAPATPGDAAATTTTTTTTATGDPAAADGTHEAPPAGSPFPIWMLVAFLGVFWLLIMMPQRKEKKKRAALMAALTKGDKVQTIGGIIGTVVEVRDLEVILKVDENANTRMRFTRAAIATIVADEPAKA